MTYHQRKMRRTLLRKVSAVCDSLDRHVRALDKLAKRAKHWQVSGEIWDTDLTLAAWKVDDAVTGLGRRLPDERVV